jgi:ATP adenylyltransferase
MRDSMLEKGTLWQSILRTTGQALATGALRSFPTDRVFIEDGGIRFFIRIMAALRQKADARSRQDESAQAGRNIDPFLPPEKDLTVTDVTDTHIAVLNKYNVVDHHLLIITRHYEDQRTLLTLRDFEALWICMAEYTGLCFYNGGREAGASQEHKHLQMVPLPLAPEGPLVPIAPLLPRSFAMGVPGTVPGLPFRHSFVRLRHAIAERPRETALETFDLYADMLSRVGMDAPRAAGLSLQSLPYCLILTREWMLLVPRSREHVEDISLNSLAYAGSFFVANAQLFERLKGFGPMHALKAAAFPHGRT